MCPAPLILGIDDFDYSDEWRERQQEEADFIREAMREDGVTI